MMRQYGVYTLLLTLLVVGYFIYPAADQNELQEPDDIGQKQNYHTSAQSADHPERQPVADAVKDKKPMSGQAPAVHTSPSELSPEVESLRAVEESAREYDAVMRYLHPMLFHVDPDVRYEAVASVGEYQHADINFDLIHAINDPDPAIRTTAIEGLGMQDDASVVFYLESALYDDDKQVRLAAIRAIAGQENDESVHALSGLLSDRDGDIRLNAVAALGEIDAEASRYYLQEQQYDPDQRVRQSVEAILTEFDDLD
jgi:hypothetical protein